MTKWPLNSISTLCILLYRHQQSNDGISIYERINTLQVEGKNAISAVIYSRKDPPRRGSEKWREKREKGLRNCVTQKSCYHKNICSLDRPEEKAWIIYFVLSTNLLLTTISYIAFPLNPPIKTIKTTKTRKVDLNNPHLQINCIRLELQPIHILIGLGLLHCLLQDSLFFYKKNDIYYLILSKIIWDIYIMYSKTMVIL